MIGLGGRSHVGVKFAQALGAHVVTFTTSPGKTEDARADEVVLSRMPTRCRSMPAVFDFMFDAVSADHDINAYINLLRRDGNVTPRRRTGEACGGLCLPPSVRTPQLIPSVVGSTPRRRRCSTSEGRIASPRNVEVIPSQKVNEVYQRRVKSDVKYRFIDIGLAQV